MDQTIINLAAQVMTILMPFVSKGREEFAAKVGDAAYEKAGRLLTLLKQKWSGDKKATDRLADFEKEPEPYQSVIEHILMKKLSEDKDLAAEISRLLQEAPEIIITQRFEEGKQITGLEAGKMHKGKGTITQEVKKAEDVTGAKIDEIG